MAGEEAKGERKQDIRYIVRIASKDLDGSKPVYRALAGIKGISSRMARMIAILFEKQSGIEFHSKLGAMPEERDKELEKIVLNPFQAGIPEWALNRRKDFYSGQNWHAVMSDLDLELRKDLQRLSMIKSYRGLRHFWGLPVRGQRTKSTHRGKGGVVGVTKKDAKAAAAAKPLAGQTAKPAAPAKGK